MPADSFHGYSPDAHHTLLSRPRYLFARVELSGNPNTVPLTEDEMEKGGQAPILARLHGESA